VAEPAKRQEGGERRSERPRDEPTPWRVEGKEPEPKDGAVAGMRPPGGRRFWLFFLGLLVLNYVLVSLFSGETGRLDVPYTVFREQVDAGNVAEIKARGEDIQGEFKREVTYPRGEDGRTEKEFETVRPSFAEDDLYETLVREDVVVSAEPLDQPRSFLATLLLSFGPTILLVALFIFLLRRTAGAAGGLSAFGRSRARRYQDSERRTTFQDVAGIEEAEEQLVEVVDFLKNPNRYLKLGAAIPRGVLLSGPPGTGKTLLARAVAGEADVPFFSLSASEFIEAIVGIGASRVRDLFDQAKKAAPAIVFIDELDAIGRARGGAGGVLSGHDEREQTLNQILTEMDGFTGAEGVIVLAATNRPDVLDPALLRPGRFDRRVAVSPPDQTGRKHILEVHSRGVPLADDVDLNAIASTTPGMVGADLKNLVNEAALLAARRGHEKVAIADFTDALEKIVLGAERRLVMSEEERRRTAYHEGGHAILGMIQPGADPVRKVSIVPRGRALGVTFQAPDADRYGYDVAYLRGRLTGALGGRAAEEIVFGDVTTGAESDLEQVTRIARQMVGRWGMSERIGKVSVLPRPEDEAAFAVSGARISDQTLELVDAEVRRIVDECYEVAVEELKENRDRLDRLAAALLEHETLDEADAYRIAGVERRPEERAAATEEVGV
jgi:cell division protease FtsH